MKVKNLEMGQWSPPLPKYYQNLQESSKKEIRDYPTSTKRNRFFIYETDTGIPVIGKISAHNKFEDSIYFVDEDLIVVETTCRISNAPYSENFHLTFAHIIKKKSTLEVEFHQTMNVKWVKSVLFLQNKLEAKL